MARKVGSNKADIVKRQTLVVELRQTGWSFRAIGEKLGITHVQAIYDLRNAIAELNKLKLDTTDDYKTIELERLDALTRALDPMAMVGNVNSVNAYIRVMERRAKLLGLDAPMKQDININLSELTDDELRLIAEGKG